MAHTGGRILAILGPTNTGKTYLAIERMVAHASGMIGFPLRLLARENYDRVAAMKGAANVALVTGEERIVPAHPRWWICTVEAMPLEREVACLAVDEIQLCADPERGHIFTDRLLHARGLEETLFLGADTIRPLLQLLEPRAELIERSRLSTLSFAGYRKATRLPPRSAIVACSAAEVYETAELVRRQRGGTAVVLGALSPRTRNAQIAMYQSGEVDYLVATDAIGMGLNMDVDHVAFARLTKFDGHVSRALAPSELGQIAGRAGRHMTNGTFGSTGEAGELDAVIAAQIENHRFETLQKLYWRNPSLDFRAPQTLLKSLEYRPSHRALVRARPADDQLALTSLLRDDEILRLAANRERLRLLWDVCQIPDFRKTMSDQHARLLGEIYRHLTGPARKLPVDAIARNVARLDRVDGDIDTLTQRIAHVRTWTYVAHRADWLDDPAHWQATTRALEDRMSDALHERLTQRFVDRRSTLLVRRLRDGGELLAGIAADGNVTVEGHPIGRLEGFRFTADGVAVGEEARAVQAAARRALRGDVARRAQRLEADGDDAFTLDGRCVLWRGVAIGELSAGAALRTPLFRLQTSGLLDGDEAQRIAHRVARWLKAEIARRLPALARLDDAPLDGLARGVAWTVARAGGSVPRDAVAAELRGLDRTGLTALTACGLRVGPEHVYVAGLGRPATASFLALLWQVAADYRGAVPAIPSGPVSFVADTRFADGFYASIGWPRFGSRAVRIDILDRFAQSLWHAAADGRLASDTGWSRRLGCDAAAAESVVIALGWRRIVEPDGSTQYRRARKAGRPPQPAPSEGAFAALAAWRGRR